MQDETTIEDTEEVDLFDAFANEGIEVDEDTIDDDEDDDQLDVLTDDPDKLKALLLKERSIKHKRNQALRKSQKTNKRILAENGQLTTRLDTIEDRINKSSTDASGDAERQKLEQEALAWQERIDEDPTQISGYLDWKQGLLEQRMGSYLTAMNNTLSSKIDGLSKSTNPEMMQNREKIEKLKQNPRFAELPDDTLLLISQTLGDLKVAQPRGNVGKGANRQSAPATDPNESVLSDEQRIAMGF